VSVSDSKKLSRQSVGYSIRPQKSGLVRHIWLYLSIFIGCGLRFLDLDRKLPWTEELTAIGLSLGNSFDFLPLDRSINVTELLSPLIPPDRVNPIAAMVGGMAELHQPPLYFGLLHLWLRLFPPQGGLVHLWGARALSALIGTLTIPIVYTYSHSIFKSRSIANLTAAMLAVSPYAVYLSQEALPYHLAALWATISIGCTVEFARYLSGDRDLRWRSILLWTLVNYLGLATHYLFAIVVVAETVALAIIGIRNRQLSPPLIYWQKLSSIAITNAIGLAIAGYAWISTIDFAQLTWYKQQPHKSIEIFNPIFHAIGVLITSVSLLLVEVDSIPLVLGSGIVMFIFICWGINLCRRVLKLAWNYSKIEVELATLGSLSAIAIAIYPLFNWIFGVDISRGARFHFTYFPAIVLLLGLVLGLLWQHFPSIGKIISGRQSVAIVLLMGLVSSTIVSTDYGYRKYYRPEELIPAIARSAPYPVTIATTYQQPTQIGGILGLVWAIYHSKQHHQLDSMRFLFVSQTYPTCKGDKCPATLTLNRAIAHLLAPTDLWAIDFNAPIVLPTTCSPDKSFIPQVYGYNHQLYRCRSHRDVNES
jgi:uncharacterized membrane protein